MDSSVASREDFNNLSDSVEFNTTEIQKLII